MDVPVVVVDMNVEVFCFPQNWILSYFFNKKKWVAF